MSDSDWALVVVLATWAIRDWYLRGKLARYRYLYQDRDRRWLAAKEQP